MREDSRGGVEESGLSKEKCIPVGLADFVDLGVIVEGGGVESGSIGEGFEKRRSVLARMGKNETMLDDCDELNLEFRGH